MPFALDSNPDLSELSEAVNYILANFGGGSTVDPVTGQIIAPGGTFVGYIYKYIAVKYADSSNGSVNFSNSPVGRSYFGLRNSNDIQVVLAQQNRFGILLLAVDRFNLPFQLRLQTLVG
jgi:hypothetical protein